MRVLVKILLANVLDLVLENRVKMIPTAHQVNIVVVVIKVANVPDPAGENGVIQMKTVFLENVVIAIRTVKQEIAT